MHELDKTLEDADEFKAWFTKTMMNADGDFNHLPDWLTEDMRRAWDAGRAAVVTYVPVGWRWYSSISGWVYSNNKPDGWPSEPVYLRSAPAPAGEPAVKALEWDCDAYRGHVSRGPLTYEIKALGKWTAIGWRGIAQVFRAEADTFDGAVALAQADFETRSALVSAPSPAPISAADAKYNVQAIAKVISLSYGEDPDEDAPLGKICGSNNEPLPNWMAYEEQAKAVFTWMMAVIDKLDPASPTPVSAPVGDLKLSEEDLDTINVCAWNEQTGRVTRYEMRELIRVYRAALRSPAVGEVSPNA
jgi:hypothetical protein